MTKKIWTTGVLAALLLAIRLIAYFPRVLEDLNSHARGPGFFTVVAATCVLGSQLAIVAIGIVLGLLVGFSLVSVAFWAWFRFRQDQASEEPTI